MSILKTKALSGKRKLLNLEQAQVLVVAYISPNFRYFPLISMFCGKMRNNLIMKTHYEPLGLFMIHKHDPMRN